MMDDAAGLAKRNLRRRAFCNNDRTVRQGFFSANLRGNMRKKSRRQIAGNGFECGLSVTAPQKWELMPPDRKRFVRVDEIQWNENWAVVMRPQSVGGWWLELGMKRLARWFSSFLILKSEFTKKFSIGHWKVSFTSNHHVLVHQKNPLYFDHYVNKSNEVELLCVSSVSEDEIQSLPKGQKPEACIKWGRQLIQS